MATLQPGEKARMYALGGIARGGATRGGYVSGAAFINFDGSQIAGDVLLGSLSIEDRLDEAPNTCRFTVHGSVPATGQDVSITLGSINRLEKLFAGVVLTVEQGDVGRDHVPQAACTAVDWTWLLGFHLVTKRYGPMQAGSIAADLIATYAEMNGFTTLGVEDALPNIDEITFTNEDLPSALTRLARRAGCYWKVDYLKDLKFGIDLNRNGSGDPEALTLTHKSFNDLTRSREQTQALTRVYVEGRGSTLLNAVNAGDTMIPLEAVDMFAVAADVFAKLSFQGSDGGAQHVNFAGVIPGGAGAVVGPGMGPASGVTLALQAGAGVTAGLHHYAVSFTTATGESLLSPATSITTGNYPDPLTPIAQPTTYASKNHTNLAQTLVIGHVYVISYSYSTTQPGQPDALSHSTLLAPASPPITAIDNKDPLNPGVAARIDYYVPIAKDPRIGVILIHIKDLTRGDTGFYWNLRIDNPWQSSATTVYAYITTSDTLYPSPTTNNTAQAQVQISNIPIGSSSVTGRKLYRTIAGGVLPFKLLTTIANNTATTYLDTAADGALGANAPASDTSGLQHGTPPPTRTGGPGRSGARAR